MTRQIKWQKLIGIFAVLLLVSQAGTALADGGGQPLEKEVAGYHVQLVFAAEAVTGQNELTVKLLDAHEQPVSAATIDVYAAPDTAHSDEDAAAPDAHSDAPAADPHGQPAADEHGSEAAPPAMQMGSETPDDHDAAETQAAHDEEAPQRITFTEGDTPGSYHGNLTFASAGQWNISVQFSTAGTSAEALFSVPVAGNGSRNLVLAGFAGLNTAVIIVAAILKRRPAPAKTAQAWSQK